MTLRAVADGPFVCEIREGMPQGSGPASARPAQPSPREAEDLPARPGGRSCLGGARRHPRHRPRGRPAQRRLVIHRPQAPPFGWKRTSSKPASPMRSRPRSRCCLSPRPRSQPRSQEGQLEDPEGTESWRDACGQAWDL